MVFIQHKINVTKQVLRNVELENALLRTELSLHQKEESIRELERTNRRLQQDILQSKMTSSRAIKQFERRTNDANRKLAQMNSELARAQEHARRFQGLLTVERRKQKGLKVLEIITVEPLYKEMKISFNQDT